MRAGAPPLKPGRSASYDFSYARKGLAVRLLYLGAALAYRQWLRLARSSPSVILCYHAVSPAQAGAFERQMKSIAGRCAPLDDLAESRGGIAVTFDDAFACLLRAALPVTERLGIPTTVFAVAGNLGRPPAWEMEPGRADTLLPTMAAEELASADRLAGCQVGSHTMSHRPLALLDAAEADRELRGSREALAAILGREVRYLALPHGSYSAETVRLAREAGYRPILTLDEIADCGRWPEGTMGRFLVSPDMWPLEFRLTVEGAYAWLYSWRQLLRRMRGSDGGRPR